MGLGDNMSILCIETVVKEKSKEWRDMHGAHQSSKKEEESS